MLIINEENFKSEVEEAKGLVLIDFFASWCGPCKMISPILEELSGEMPDVKFCKVDVDESPSLARMFKVESIPFLALVRDNTFLDMSVGYRSKDDLISFINSNK
jgi:thioredoxin 1